MYPSNTLVIREASRRCPPNRAPRRVRPTAVVAASASGLAAHRVYFVAELVEKRDLRPRLTPSGDLTQGPGPAAPQRLGAASRPIARRLHEDLACRGRAATTPPDFRTIRDGRTQAWSHGDTWPWTAGTSRPRPRSTRRCATTGGCRRRGTAYGTRPPKPMPGTTTVWDPPDRGRTAGGAGLPGRAPTDHPRGARAGGAPPWAVPVPTA